VNDLEVISEAVIEGLMIVGVVVAVIVLVALTFRQR